MLKRINISLLIILVSCMCACVDNEPIEIVESNSLVFNCEMLRGSSMITATCSTANNLKGTQPIEHPTDAKIKLFIGNDTPFVFVYDVDKKYYVLKNGKEAFQYRRADFRIVVELPGSEIPGVEATSAIPTPNSIECIELIREDTVAIGEKKYFQKDIKVTLKQANSKQAYYHLNIEEEVTFVKRLPTDTVYTKLGKRGFVAYTNVIEGGSGMHIMNHRNGVLIDYSRLDEAAFVLRVTSKFPITEVDQSFDLFNSTLYSVTEDYYRYHISRSKLTLTSDESLANPVISSSNITGGFGHFSALTQIKQSFMVSK